MGEHVYKHRIVVRHYADDDYPYVARIECDWGTDPGRPCLAVTCSNCCETSFPGCLEAGHDAEPVPGCGVQAWLEATGTEGIVIENLEAAVSADVYWNGDGWVLSCKDLDPEEGE